MAALLDRLAYAHGAPWSQGPMERRPPHAIFATPPRVVHPSLEAPRLAWSPAFRLKGASDLRDGQRARKHPVADGASGWCQPFADTLGSAVSVALSDVA